MSCTFLIFPNFRLIMWSPSAHQLWQTAQNINSTHQLCDSTSQQQQNLQANTLHSNTLRLTHTVFHVIYHKFTLVAVITLPVILRQQRSPDFSSLPCR